MTDPIISDNRKDRCSLLLLCGVAVLVSLCYVSITYAPGFITGHGSFWQFRTDDCAIHLVGSRYYIHDAWRFPLFDVQGINYPSGTNIIFTDSLPLMALLAKGIYKISSWEWNYFGLWAVIAGVLHALSIVLLLDSMKVRSLPITLCALMFGFCVYTHLFLTFYHIALSSHFLILLGLALYFYASRSARINLCAGLFILLLVTALLIHLYLFVMVYVLFIATLISVRFRQYLSFRQSAFWFFLSCAIIAVQVLGMGYFRFGGMAFSSSTPGQALYPFNLIELLVPNRFSVLYHPIYSKLSTQGDYLGLGVIVLWLYIFIRRPKQFIDCGRRHLCLAFSLAGLFVFSLSNSIHFANHIVFSYHLPGLHTLFETFRATGRFIWPILFLASIVPLVLFWRYDRNQKYLWALLFFAALLQNADVWKLRMYVREETGRAVPSESLALLEPLVPRYNMIIIETIYDTFGGRYMYEARTLYFLAGKYHIPTNYACAARSQDPQLTFEQIVQKTLSFNEPVLYALSNQTYQQFPMKGCRYITSLNGLVLVAHEP